jgi:hypothetical protein
MDFIWFESSKVDNHHRFFDFHLSLGSVTQQAFFGHTFAHIAELQ